MYNTVMERRFQVGLKTKKNQKSKLSYSMKNLIQNKIFLVNSLFHNQISIIFSIAKDIQTQETLRPGFLLANNSLHHRLSFLINSQLNRYTLMLFNQRHNYFNNLVPTKVPISVKSKITLKILNLRKVLLKSYLNPFKKPSFQKINLKSEPFYFISYFIYIFFFILHSDNYIIL